MDEEARDRLRAARKGAGLTVRELSRRVGISPSMLSQIENGHVQPSVATLYALVSALSMSVDEILTGSRRADPARQVGEPGAPILRSEDRAGLVLDSGVTWERLTPEPDQTLDALLVTYPPGSISSVNGGLMRHGGHEYGYLLEGELLLKIGFDEYVVRAGDSLSFASSIPHLYRNDGQVEARGVWYVVGGDPEDRRLGPP